MLSSIHFIRNRQHQMTGALPISTVQTTCFNFQHITEPIASHEIFGRFSLFHWILVLKGTSECAECAIDLLIFVNYLYSSWAQTGRSKCPFQMMSLMPVDRHQWHHLCLLTSTGIEIKIVILQYCWLWPDRWMSASWHQPKTTMSYGYSLGYNKDCATFLYTITQEPARR